MTSVLGRCLCQAIVFRIDARLTDAVLCHCSECRKLSGSAFFPFVYVDRDALHMIAGADGIARYAKNPESIVCFCSTCGANLFVEKPERGELALYLGCLEDLPAIDFDTELFVESAAAWNPLIKGV